MRKTRLLAGSMLSLLVLASVVASQEPGRKPKNACTAIQVTSPDAPAQTSPGSTKPGSTTKFSTFSASTILDLKLEVGLSPGVKGGQHQLEFKVFTPKGHLYQSLPATMAAPTAIPGQPDRMSPKRTAEATLPVAGTTIVTNSLYGEWRVEAYFDGARETACARPVFFVIEP